MPSDDSAEVLHKIEQTSNRFQCSPRTIRNLVEAGELEAVRLGRAVRITVASEDAYLERLHRREAANRATKAVTKDKRLFKAQTVDPPTTS